MINLQTYLADAATPVASALQMLDNNSAKILLITDNEQHLLGTVTDGDIRRWILAKGDLAAPVVSICNKKPNTVSPGYQISDVRAIMLEKRLSCIPVVDLESRVVDLLFWDQLFSDARKEKSKHLPIPVVIMAGGEGSRLAPFTAILPKPLIPIGDKTIIEIIINRFLEYGVKKFHLTVNHKSLIIKSYFKEIKPSYKVVYVPEPKPLGTAGSLRYLAGSFTGPFVVTNCDIVVNCNYEDVYRYHLQQKNDITLVASLKNYSIPYGVCSIGDNGVLLEHIEKPSYNFLVNTGFYIIDAKVLDLIPENEFFHMTDLISRVQAESGRVGVFPVSEDSWVDIGEWEEYRKAASKISQLSGA